MLRSALCSSCLVTIMPFRRHYGGDTVDSAPQLPSEAPAHVPLTDAEQQALIVQPSRKPWLLCPPLQCSKQSLITSQARQQRHAVLALGKAELLRLRCAGASAGPSTADTQMVPSSRGQSGPGFPAMPASLPILSSAELDQIMELHRRIHNEVPPPPACR